jgi:hypothetical protein
MNKDFLYFLKRRAIDLQHRNNSQKDELIKDIISYLNVSNQSNIIPELSKISFEYIQLYKGYHPAKRHDEEWKRGKKELIDFLNRLS